MRRRLRTSLPPVGGITCAWPPICCFGPTPQLDQNSLGYLRQRFAEAAATTGWPGLRQYRFEGQGVRVMLWSWTGRCDWWISASSEQSVKTIAPGLLELSSDLHSALLSGDDFGTGLLDELHKAS
jgi:hypothetical protein